MADAWPACYSHWRTPVRRKVRLDEREGIWSVASAKADPIRSRASYTASAGGRAGVSGPRLELARKLAIGANIPAMIDISDGLSRDASHIAAESDVGPMIEAAAVPIHDDAKELSQRDGVSPFDHALHDGEDHELLAALPPEAEAMALDLGMIQIGEVIEGPRIWIERDGQRTPIQPRGWEHVV